MSSTGITQVLIASHADVVNARRCGRSIAAAAHFEAAETVLVAATISELARNIVLHGKRGQIALQVVEKGERRGVRIVATDEGPGIRDLGRAMRPGHSTWDGLGPGLAAVKRVMDEFEVHSSPSAGTRVDVIKWRRRQAERHRVFRSPSEG